MPHCNPCGESFGTKRGLRTHNIQIHPKSTESPEPNKFQFSDKPQNTEVLSNNIPSANKNISNLTHFTNDQPPSGHNLNETHYTNLTMMDTKQVIKFSRSSDNLTRPSFKTTDNLDVNENTLNKKPKILTPKCKITNNPNPNINKDTSKESENIDGFKIVCQFCDLTMPSNKKLIRHYNSEHGQNIITKTIYIDNIEDLDKWKTNNLKTEIQSLNLKSRNKIDSNKAEYYKCNYRVKKDRHCTAFATMTKHTNDTVKVKFSTYHIHPTNWDQVQLPLSKKLSIIADIEAGIPIATIYINLVSSVDNEITSKSQTLTMGYLQYLKRQCANKIILDQNDYTSLIKMKNAATEFKKNNKYIIEICFKNLGEEVSKYNIQSDDFIFAFTTPKLLEKYNEFCGKGVLFDSTHSTNQYSYPLVVGMVVTDDFTAFPFIYILCSSEREDMLTYVFEILKN